MNLTTSDISCKWNQQYLSCCDWFISFNRIPSRWNHVVDSVRQFFLRLNNIPLLSIDNILFIRCLIMDACSVSLFWLLSIMLLWTWVYKYIWISIFSPFGYIRNGITGSYDNFMFNLLRNYHTIFIAAVSFYIPNFSTSLPTLIFYMFAYFLSL